MLNIESLIDRAVAATGDAAILVVEQNHETGTWHASIRAVADDDQSVITLESDWDVDCIGTGNTLADAIMNLDLVCARDAEVVA